MTGLINTKLFIGSCMQHEKCFADMVDFISRQFHLSLFLSFL